MSRDVHSLHPPRSILEAGLIHIAASGILIEELALAMLMLIWIRELRFLMLLSGIDSRSMLHSTIQLQCFRWILLCNLLLFIFPDDTAWLSDSHRRLYH